MVAPAVTEAMAVAASIRDEARGCRRFAEWSPVLVRPVRLCPDLLCSVALRYLATTSSASPSSCTTPFCSQRHRSHSAFTSLVSCETKRIVAPLRAQFVNLAHAALAEGDIADREGFVHDQDFRVHVRGHREGQAQHHAGRIGPDRLVDEVPDLGEAFDRGKAGVDFLTRQARAAEPLR